MTEDLEGSSERLLESDALWRPQERVRIGVVGPDDLVERVLMLPSDGTEGSLMPRLVPLPYTDEKRMLETLASRNGDMDAYLFTGPVPYDLAVAADALSAPATYVPLSGAALYACLIRGITDGDFGANRLSIDTLVGRDVEEAYSELGLATTHIELYSHAPGHHLEDIVTFHSDSLSKRGVTAALTGLRSAHEEMLRRGLRSYRMVPTSQSIRAALRTAVLLATGARLGDAQVAMAIVAVGGMDPSSELNLLNDRRADSMLAAQQVLLTAAREIGAVILPVGASLFLVAGTVKSFEIATHNYRHCPFFAAVAAETGESVSVGLGLADTALAAHRTAWQGLLDCQQSGGGHGRLVRADGSVVVLPGLHGDRTVRDGPRIGRVERRYLTELSRRFRTFGSEPGAPDPIVSAEEVAELLDLSPRTARRLLGSLSDAHLAWPLPPERGPHPGRPRHRWRLLVSSFPTHDTDI